MEEERSEVVWHRLMSGKKKGDADYGILVNNLTLKDAVPLVKTEGGSLSKGQIAFRVATILVVAAFTARAIVVGQATAWHLFLPMVGEYLVLLVSIPLISLILHDPALRKDARRSLYWILALAVIASLWIGSQS
ncbi:MAG: hypothetical protein ABL994_09715, partial [Verrucomicrobiales bacterium]